MTSIYGKNINELVNFAKILGYSRRSVEIYFGYIYRNKKQSHLSYKLLKMFQEEFHHTLPKINKIQKSSDGTTKLLIEFLDGNQVETVLLPFWKKYGLCVSSQVGCAMNCSFCHTATQGFKRNLTAAEIVMQIIVAKNFLLKEGITQPLTNIVFMGQGEPLHNFDEVKQAINIISDIHGLGIGKRSITVSTSGYLPGLKRFKELDVNLALSLHSVKKSVRGELIPINRAYPLSEVIKAIDEIELKKRQVVEYEYLLIQDVNDKTEDIKLIGKLLKSRSHVLNIIPFNPFPGSQYSRPSTKTIAQFKKGLINEGLRVMVRQTKGEDILAACGQLKS